MSSVYGPSLPPSASYGVASEPEASPRVNKTMLVAGLIFGAIAVAAAIGIAFVANPVTAVALLCISIGVAMIALPLILFAVLPSSSSTTYLSDTHHTDVVVVGSPPVHHSSHTVFVDSSRAPPPVYVSGMAARPSHPVVPHAHHSDGVRMGNPLRETSSVPSRGHGGYAVVGQRR